jgi:hypothetical protein
MRMSIEIKSLIFAYNYLALIICTRFYPISENDPVLFKHDVIHDVILMDV